MLLTALINKNAQKCNTPKSSFGHSYYSQNHITAVTAQRSYAVKFYFSHWNSDNRHHNM